MDLKNFAGFKSKLIYSVAGICQALAFVLHILLLNDLEEVCTETQTEASRAHITASIVLNAIGLVLCGLWVTIRNQQKKDPWLAAWLATPFAVWSVKIAWIATTALSFLFAASLYGLTIGLRDTCTDFDGRGLSLTALLLFTAGLAAGHLGAKKKHDYESLAPPKDGITRQIADPDAAAFGEGDSDDRLSGQYSVRDNLRF
jgi:hypothetical protein